jgi:serine/threonine protein kinase
MSPEILYNEPYSIKCDVWSLGVTIYKMLYGVCPWSAQNLVDLIKMVKKKIDFPKNDQVSTELKVIISRTLIPNEADRISIK